MSGLRQTNNSRGQSSAQGWKTKGWRMELLLKKKLKKLPNKKLIAQQMN
jgi:hypothetical protein